MKKTTKMLSLVASAAIVATSAFAAFTTSAAGDGITVTAGTVTGAPGEEVIVPITLSGNDAEIWNLGFKVNYDTDKLTLVENTDTKLLTGGVHSGSVDTVPFVFGWANSDLDNYADGNGVIANMKFKIADDATGDFTIDISYNDGDIIDVNGDSVTAAIVDGKVTSACKEHTYGDYVCNEDNTCTNNGTKTRTCSACGAEDTVADEDHKATGHDFAEYAVTKAATCEEKGTETATCANGCGTTDSKDIAALGHKYTDYKVTTEATCEAKGTETATCDNGCGKTDSKDIAALGHNFDEYTVKSEATCEADEVQVGTCTECDKEVEKTIEGTALGHDWAKVDDQCVAPTCTEAGKDVYVCGNDDTHTKEEAVDALGHTWEEDAENSVAPTCTEDGVKASKCSVCDETTTEVAPATGHSFGDWAVSADDETKEVRTCETCGATEERDVQVDDGGNSEGDDNTTGGAGDENDGSGEDGKDSPDTGVEDVAVAAGLAIVAAGAIVIAKKRNK